MSAASDGEASAEQARPLRAHLRSCHSCRALLRDYRSVPARLAELLPPVVLAPAIGRGGWWSRLYESLAAGSADRAGAVGHKLQHAGDLIGAQKATAVVASTAALAGGVAVERRALHERDRARGSTEQRAPERSATSAPAEPSPLAPANEHGASSDPLESRADGSGEDGVARGAPAPEGEFSPERTAIAATARGAGEQPAAGEFERPSSLATVAESDRPRAGAGEFGP